MNDQSSRGTTIRKDEIFTSLLTTKLHIPPTPQELVSRPRLIERLNEGLNSRLILISAPAGFGKTTLLSEALRNINRPVSWVSLDDGDNDPSLFWAYFIAALQTIEPDLGRSSLARLRMPDPPHIESVLIDLINEMTALQSEFTIVLDDYHAIKTQTTHKSLAFFLEHMPLQTCLVLSSRVDPPLPLTRLRGRGQLTELRAADLRFTLSETTFLLKEVMALKLSDEQVKTLNARTEGWIASLQMAAVSIQRRTDIPAFIDAFNGTHHFILDYLTQEVLNCQEPSVQSFLLKTSVLDRMTGPLCDAVTMCDDGQAMLEQLESSNLFLEGLDDERRWFRYHHLFGELLRSQLNRQQSDLVPVLHRRASEWFECEGLTEKAIHNAFAAKDFERAADLIDKVALTMIKENDFSTLLGWLARLPGELIASRLWLCFCGALAYETVGRLDAVEPFLKHAEVILARVDNIRTSEDLPDRARICGMVKALRARTAWDRGDIPGTIEICADGLRDLPEDDLHARPLLKHVLGVAYWAKGDLEIASHYLDEAETDAHMGGHYQNALTITGSRAGICIEKGQLHRAAHICEEAIKLVDEWGEIKPFPATCYVHIFLADVLYQWNRLDEALQHAIRGTELSELGGDSAILQKGYTLLAQVYLAQGKRDVAMDSLRRARSIIHHSHMMTTFSLPIQTSLLRLLLSQGDIAAAEEWFDTWWRYFSKSHGDTALSNDGKSHIGNGHHYWLKMPHLTIARIHTVEGRVDEIPDVLEAMRQEAEANQWTGRLIEILTLQAMAFQSQGQLVHALDVLERAFSIAETESYVRMFVDEGKPMLELLRYAESKGISPSYVAKLSGAFSGSMPDRTGHSYRLETDHLSVLPLDDSSNLIEPLTEREFQMLRLISAGLSNLEMATTLCVSVNTIKVHTRNLYGKLNVRSRTQALRRAVELNLLPRVVC